MTGTKRTLPIWAALLGVRDRNDNFIAELTLEEAMLLALISCNDRLVEIQGKLEDLAGRYQELDKWLEASPWAAGYRSKERSAPAIEGGNHA
jgi:hypothetical protein